MKKIILAISAIMLLAGCSKATEADDMLWSAISHKNYELAKEAVDSGAQLDEFVGSHEYEQLGNGKRTKNPILTAASVGESQTAKYLIANGADVNVVDKHSVSILQYAAQYYPKIVEPLLEAGADITYADKDGLTAIDYAVRSYTDTPYNVLSEYGAVPTETTLSLLLDVIDTDKYGILHDILTTTKVEPEDKAVLGAFTGNFELVKANITNENRSLALDGIAAFGNAEVLAELIKDGDDITELFTTAVKYANVDTAKYLLDTYDDISPDQLHNIMYYAASAGGREMLDLLNGSYLDIDMTEGALGALSAENTDNILWFMENGLEPELHTALLETSCILSSVETVEFLIEHGADVNGRNAATSPLSVAAEYGRTDILTLLLENGADTNACEDCPSPLMEAVSRGQFECVKILIEYGADVNYTYDGKSVADMAKSAGSERVYEYITAM